MKKSQISVFMLAGTIIVLVSMIALLIVFYSKDMHFITSEPTEVGSFANDCFMQAETCLLYRLGSNGGSTLFEQHKYSLDEIAENSKGYFTSASLACEDNLSKFAHMDIKSGSLYPQLIFNQRDTKVDVKQDISYRIGDSIKKESDFESTLPVRFRVCYSLSENLKQNELASIDDSYINSNLLENEELDIDIYKGKAILISLTDTQSVIEGEKYTFNFIK